MKRKDQKEKTSLLSDLRAFFRAVKIGYRLDRKFFFMQTVNGASFIFRNMITNIIAALVINGVYRGESEQTLMLYALVAVFANFLLNLAVLFTANRRYIRKSMWTMFISRFFNRCSEKMDYAHFEDIRVKDMRRRIDRYNSRWQGIANFWAWYYVVVAFTGVAANVTILSTMLFRFDHSHTEGILWFVNTPYALVLFLAVLVGYYLFSVWYNQYTKRVSVDYDEHWTKNGRRMMTMLGYPTDTKRAMDMKIYGLDRAIYQTVSDFAANDKKATGDAHLKYGLSNVLNSIAYYGLMFFSYAFVGLKVLSGAFGIGSLVLYVTTMLGFADAFREFGETVGVIQGSRKVYDDEFGYIDMENKMQKGIRLPDLEKPGHTVEFRNVSFKYPAAEAYALSHVNISFGLSERLAVVGMNGSGKTTFIKLLCRLYDPDEGGDSP